MAPKKASQCHDTPTGGTQFLVLGSLYMRWLYVLLLFTRRTRRCRDSTASCLRRYYPYKDKQAAAMSQQHTPRLRVIPTQSPCPPQTDKNHRSSMSTNISQPPYLPLHQSFILSLKHFRHCTRASKHTHRPSLGIIKETDVSDALDIRL